jgi:hypothetical protein
MRSISRLIPVLLVSVLAMACGKAPAEQALKAADAAIEAARPQVEKFVPAEWQALSDGAAAAKAQFDKGQYKEAMTAAQALLPQVQAAVTAAESKKQQLTTAFEALKGSLPGALDALSKQVTAYAAMKKLPAGLDKAAVAAAQAELPNVNQAWTAATTAFDGGDVMKAFDGAMQVKSKVDELTKTLMPTATAASPKAK